MEPILPFALDLPPAGSRRLLQVLHRELRAAIVEGRMRPGLRLPATRRLATSLGISRNSVLAAYDRLLAEGHVVGRPGSGTYVAGAAARAPRAATAKPARPARAVALAWRHAEAPAPTPGPLRFDLRLGTPDIAQFPFATWRRLAARALRAAARAPAAYDDVCGRPALRAAIAAHVSFARAVACSADDVVVTAGAQQAFDLLARVLVTPGRTVVAVEDPGYPPLRRAFQAAGAVLDPVPVDHDGLRIERLRADTRIVCATPSHQFPLGVAMAPRRRAALLDFAAARDALVVEDDYDGEFRHGGAPLDALQTLDRAARVFYVGTFSKSLFPALRIGFVVAPTWARPALVAAKHAADLHNPVLEQDVLAAFIAEGHLARHVRRMRRIYSERRDALVEALRNHAGGLLAPVPAQVGLHVAARLVGRQSGDAIAARAAVAGIGVESLERYAVGRPRLRGLAFGLGACPAPRIAEAIARLASA